jgi:hypothetical protein
VADPLHGLRRLVTGAGLAGPGDNYVVPSDREILARRITAVLLLVGTAVAILALADVGPFEDRTEEDRVRETVEEFVEARGERDFGAVCDLLTPTLRSQVQATSGARPGTKPPSCAQVLTSESREGSSERDADVEVVDVSVSGNRARASVERTEGISRGITLELVGGEWLIATFES